VSVQRLVDALGVRAKLEAATERTLAQLKKDVGEVSPEKWAAFEHDVRCADILVDEFTKFVEEIGLTPAELDEVTAFYETPFGQRVIALNEQAQVEAEAESQAVLGPMIEKMVEEI
jgi:hypothetical protein